MIFKGGIYSLGFEYSRLEKIIFDIFCSRLEARGFKYLSIPSTIHWETIKRQELIPKIITEDKVVRLDEKHVLAGSAEQGILEYFTGQQVQPMLIYARNQCFRNEDLYQDFLRCREFLKIEQYCFCLPETWQKDFNFLLENATEFLRDLGLTYRLVDVTARDAGYHLHKVDIEISTQKWGWVETHSCTYFGSEQARRFDIGGNVHTISNTGIASPRILLPFMEGSADPQKVYELLAK